MIHKKSLEVSIAGHRLPIKTEAPLEEVQAAAALVEKKIEEVTSNRSLLTNQALLLVALNLADEYLKQERNQREFQGNIKARSEALLADLEEHFGLEP